MHSVISQKDDCVGSGLARCVTYWVERRWYRNQSSVHTLRDRRLNQFIGD